MREPFESSFCAVPDMPAEGLALPTPDLARCSPPGVCGSPMCLARRHGVSFIHHSPPFLPPPVSQPPEGCVHVVLCCSVLLLPDQLAELSPDASPREESPAAVAMTVQQLHLSDEDLACDVKACGPVIIPVFSDLDPPECRAVCVVLVCSSSTVFLFLPRAAYVCRHLECKR